MRGELAWESRCKIDGLGRVIQDLEKDGEKEMDGETGRCIWRM